MADDDIIVGSAAVEIVPSAKGWIAKAKAQILPQAEELGRAIGDTIADQISDQVRTALSEGLAGAGAVAKAKGRESGQDFGGEFGRQAQARIQAALKALPKANIGVATTEAEQKLKDLRAELAMLGDKRIGVDLDASDALAEMARLQLELETLARDTVDIDVRVDTGAALAELIAFQAFAQTAGGGVDLGSVAKGGGGLASSLGSAAGSMGVLAGGAVLLASTIGPIVGAAAGIAAALAAPLGAATVGGFLFAGLGGAAIKDVEKTRKEIEQLEKRIGTATDPKVVKRLTDELGNLKSSLTDNEKAYLSARETLGEAFNGLMDGPAGDAIFGVITQGLEVLAELLPEVEPLIVAVGDALSDALGDVDADGFGAWIDKLTELAGPAIEDVIDILGSLGGAIDSVLTSGSDEGESALNGIADAAERLNQYLNSSEGQAELQEFFDWLATDGRAVGEALWDIAGATAEWFVDAEKIGTPLIEATAFMMEMYETIGPLAGQLFFLYEAATSSIGGVINTVANLMDMWAGMLGALGHLPNFGWAKAAAKAMQDAADKARGLANDINGIPKTHHLSFTASGFQAVYDQINALNSAANKGDRVHYTAGYGGGQTAYASGGPVFGPGTGTSDSIFARLSNGEHVWTAAEVQAAGGHGAILAMRRMIASGASGFASGGPVGTAASVASSGYSKNDLRDVLDGATLRLSRDGRSVRLMTQGG